LHSSHNPIAAQPGIAADRFAPEIIGFLKARPSALAAAECQPVGPQLSRTTSVATYSSLEDMEDFSSTFPVLHHSWFEEAYEQISRRGV
jgi:hypothetical protein